MILQNLNKILNKFESELGFTTSPNQFQSIKGLPFYNWQKPEDSMTFNHVIGLPTKHNECYQLLDYERMLFEVLQHYKHVWIKKATGLGVTEFIPPGGGPGYA